MSDPKEELLKAFTNVDVEIVKYFFEETTYGMKKKIRSLRFPYIYAIESKDEIANDLKKCIEIDGCEHVLEILCETTDSLQEETWDYNLLKEMAIPETSNSSQQNELLRKISDGNDANNFILANQISTITNNPEFLLDSKTRSMLMNISDPEDSFEDFSSKLKLDDHTKSEMLILVGKENSKERSSYLKNKSKFIIKEGEKYLFFNQTRESKRKTISEMKANSLKRKWLELNHVSVSENLLHSLPLKYILEILGRNGIKRLKGIIEDPKYMLKSLPENIRSAPGSERSLALLSSSKITKYLLSLEEGNEYNEFRDSVINVSKDISKTGKEIFFLIIIIGFICLTGILSAYYVYNNQGPTLIEKLLHSIGLL